MCCSRRTSVGRTGTHALASSFRSVPNERSRRRFSVFVRNTRRRSHRFSSALRRSSCTVACSRYTRTYNIRLLTATYPVDRRRSTAVCRRFIDIVVVIVAAEYNYIIIVVISPYVRLRVIIFSRPRGVRYERPVVTYYFSRFIRHCYY